MTTRNHDTDLLGTPGREAAHVEDCLPAELLHAGFLRGNCVLFRWPAPSRAGSPILIPHTPSR